MKFIWQRPIYSSHWVWSLGWAWGWSRESSETMARQLNIFDAVLSPNIMASRTDRENWVLLFWTCVLWLNKQFYVFPFFALLCFNREMRERLNFNWVQCFSCVSVWAGFSQLYAKTTSPSFVLKRQNCRIVWCCKSRKKGRFSSHLVSTPPLFFRKRTFLFLFGARNLFDVADGMREGREEKQRRKEFLWMKSSFGKRAVEMCVLEWEKT